MGHLIVGWILGILTSIVCMLLGKPSQTSFPCASCRYRGSEYCRQCIKRNFK